jgi:hypothetical protein
MIFKCDHITNVDDSIFQRLPCYSDGADKRQRNRNNSSARRGVAQLTRLKTVPTGYARRLS